MKKYISLFAIIFIFFGCSLKAPKPFPLNPAQAEIIYRLNLRNKNLNSAKGFAKIEIREDKKKPVSVRCAFAYLLPDKIRMTFTNNFNMPIINIISNGKKFLYHDLQTDKKYEKNIKDKEVIGDLPVNITSLLTLMSGKANIISENIKKYISKNKEDIIILKDNTQITVDKKNILIIKMEEKTKSIEIKDYKKIKDYLLPYKIITTEPKKNTTITIKKYETNVKINNVIFNTGS